MKMKLAILTSHNLYQQISLTTRLTRTNVTLIDNLFRKFGQVVLENSAGVLSKRLCDHQPYFMILYITQKTEHRPKYVKINILSTESMQNVRHTIKSDVIYNKSQMLI